MTKEMTNDEIIIENIKKGVAKGIISLSEDNTKITYICSRKYTTDFKGQGERIRASFFVELIDELSFPKEKIDFDVSIPGEKGASMIRADLVVYKDIELKKPFIVFECIKDGVNNIGYNTAIDQVVYAADKLGADFPFIKSGAFVNLATYYSKRPVPP